MTKTTFRAEIEGQVLKRTSETHFYTHMVAGRRPAGSTAETGRPLETRWIGLNWCRNEKLAQKKARAARRTGWEAVILEAQIEETGEKARKAQAAVQAIATPSETCRLCGRVLESDEARARGYGDKCWRKARAAAIAGKEAQAVTRPGPQGSRDFPPPNVVTDPRAAGATRTAVRILTGDQYCFYCETPLGHGDIFSYDHPDGYDVPGYGARQWLYVVCPKCGHEWSIHKLGVTEEALLAKTEAIQASQARHDEQMARYRPDLGEPEPFPELDQILEDLAPEFDTDGLRKVLAQARQAASEDEEEETEEEEVPPIKCEKCGAGEDQVRYSAGTFKPTPDGFYIDKVDKTGPVEALWIIQRCEACGNEESWPATEEAAALANQTYQEWLAKKTGETRN